mmetsp:Transcript_123728/g.309254  ORF Transcript_123728/g.309254 Transcript_123728/m.309254 type:complete len:237 (+) Transcript_123728:25-735(+)
MMSSRCFRRLPRFGRVVRPLHCHGLGILAALALVFCSPLGMVHFSAARAIKHPSSDLRCGRFAACGARRHGKALRCGNLPSEPTPPRFAADTSLASFAAAIAVFSTFNAAPAALAVEVVPPSTLEQPAKDVLGRLQQEEQAFKDEEKEVQTEMDASASNPLEWLLNKAKLLNLKAVLTDEEAAVRDEENDLQTQNQAKFRKDVDRLEGLEKIESRLRFNGEENQELDALERMLPQK